MKSKKYREIIFILSILLLSTQFSFGQKTEIKFNAYTGLFSFRGNGSTSNSWINFNPYTSPAEYTSNPYGKKSGFSYAFELQGQRVTRGKKIYGFGISFDALTSKVNIDTVTANGFIYTKSPATGKTTLRNTFITLNPFAGHRFMYRKITLDFLAGFDIAICLRSKEVGSASTNNKDYSTIENYKPKPSFDFRPRVQIKTELNKLGFLVGYSFGLTNYQTQNNPKTYSNFLRLGLSYKLR